MLSSVVRNYRKRRRLTNQIRKILGFRLKSFKLYEIALIHKSASHRMADGTFIHNERLEYLGDAVLGTVVAEYLFDSFPEKDEGFLTEMRSKIVNRETLNRLAIKIGLDDLIISKVSDENSQNWKGDALEALIGAIFLDLGYRKTKRLLIKNIIKKHINLNYLQKTETNFKSKIIEWSQKSKQEVLFESFEEVSENNKSNPVFVSNLIVLDKVIGTGKGNSKKEAEQKAAKQALSIIGEY